MYGLHVLHILGIYLFVICSLPQECINNCLKRCCKKMMSLANDQETLSEQMSVDQKRCESRKSAIVSQVDEFFLYK